MKAQDFIDIRAICEEGSFRQAAKRLGITQPTLSNRIAYVEQRLGAPLFERDRGASRPTALALQIAQQSRNIARESDRLTRDAMRLASGETGRIGLGIGPAPAHVFLSKIISSSRKAVDDLTLECIIGSTGQLAELLLSDRIDAAVAPADEALFGHEIRAEPLVDGPLIVAGRPDHPFMTNPSTDPNEFFSHALALPLLEPNYKRLASKLYGVDMDQARNIVYCSDYSALINLVVEEGVLTAGPGFAFRKAVEQGLLKTLPLDPQRVRHRICLVTRKDRLPLPALEHVLECVRQAAAPYARSA